MTSTQPERSPAFDEAAEMYAYYDAQAETYEDFYFGKGQAVAALAPEYDVDRKGIGALLAAFGQGDVIDLACGTAFWLSIYGPNCRTVTLVDQSAVSLARCEQRVRALGLEPAAKIVRGDLFEVPMPTRTYDAAFIGFLLSHLTDAGVVTVFDRLRLCLRAGAELAIVDSAWSEARRPYRAKDGFERRHLPDGRAFTIRKKYFDLPELEELLLGNGFRLQSSYVGKVFLGVVAKHAV
jgi:demethylmenaquinone methyltransferase/2-methoxy-6-polyprenyl-1,4-benzoquinol methylase